MKLWLGSIFTSAVVGLAFAMAPIAAHAMPFAMLGLDESDWTQIADPATDGVFGRGGNGFLSNGGELRLMAKEAGFNHEFGIAASDLTGFQVLVDDEGFSDPIVIDFKPASNPFVLLARNTSGGDLSGAFAASNGSRSDSRVDLAVFFRNDNPGQFLFFFDDGGGSYGDDGDFNDMIVLATAIPEPAAIGLVGVGLLGLGLLSRRRNAA